MSQDGDAFLWACTNGHVDTVQWFHTTYNITEEEARLNTNYVFRLACKGGHLATAKYLHTAFGLTEKDAKAQGNDALRWACRNRHAETARWLHAVFRYTKQELAEVQLETSSAELLAWLAEQQAK